MRSALLVAYHFPPFKGSSGLERTLALARHLPSHGWQPIVLTVTPNAYADTSDERLGTIPDGTRVVRAPAFDAARTIAIRGRYPRWVTLPDRWQNWILTGTLAGLAAVRRHRPSVLWSTYPITSAHFIGSMLSRLTGVPWVADFRDPMVEYVDRQQTWFPTDPAVRAMRLRAEAAAAARASAMTFCTAGARDVCIQRYPRARQRHDCWVVVPNGFDETAFEDLPIPLPRPDGDPLTLIHSGTIYPTPDRDPTCFLRALGRVLGTREAAARPVQVILRGSGVEVLYGELLRELGLDTVVRFEPVVEYRKALQEVCEADGLLLFQGHASNPAIPAKLYEYFRAGRPILALVDPEGETARALRDIGTGIQAPLDDTDAIASVLGRFLHAIDDGTARGVPPAQAAQFERRHAVARMAGIFDAVAR